MMNRIPSRERVEHIRAQYPKGTRVKLDRMDDPYTSLKPGALGTVSFVDDTGTIHVDWDSGSRLGVVFGEDSCSKV